MTAFRGTFSATAIMMMLAVGLWLMLSSLPYTAHGHGFSSEPPEGTSVAPYGSSSTTCPDPMAVCCAEGSTLCFRLVNKNNSVACFNSDFTSSHTCCHSGNASENDDFQRLQLCTDAAETCYQRPYGYVSCLTKDFCTGLEHCSSRGICVDNAYCNCVNGFSGNRCQSVEAPLLNGKEYRGTVFESYMHPGTNWHFYRRATQNGDSFNIQLESVSGKCDLYIHMNDRPSTKFYVKKETSTANPKSLTIVATTDAPNYYVGVTGDPSCVYRMKMTSTAGKCPLSCSGWEGTEGVTCTENYKCECGSAFEGNLCQMRTLPLSNGDVFELTVFEDEWLYFRALAPTTHNTTFSIEPNGASSSDDVDVFARIGVLPKSPRGGHDFKSIASHSLTETIQLAPGDVPEGMMVYYGVYGYAPGQAKVLLTFNYEVSSPDEGPIEETPLDEGPIDDGPIEEHPVPPIPGTLPPFSDPPPVHAVPPPPVQPSGPPPSQAPEPEGMPPGRRPPIWRWPFASPASTLAVSNASLCGMFAMALMVVLSVMVTLL